MIILWIVSWQALTLSGLLRPESDNIYNILYIIINYIIIIIIIIIIIFIIVNSMWAACQIAKCRKKKLSSCMRNCNTVILKIYKVNSWASGNGELWVLPFFCLFFPQSKKITLSDTSSARNSSLRNTHSFSRTWPGVNYLPDYMNFRVVVGHYVTLTDSSSSFQECSGYKGHRRSIT